ncbi:Helix-turn-helix domain-containing protein [Sinosporangium album]|uniref:Helix-turn-helix domain-containing protein n=1 Tax=Sinosporangium album TaxID=504805 RepID=A0A1G8DW31_9ACTN|nr:helix-turn-helix transcriptional regulator [Sinosporangium album]SDH61815.1 Helix-turn-helix domain-containing protein [Sinosporangium album]
MPPTSASSGAQEARQHLADQLREIRKAAGLNGTELARLAGWPGVAKVSRVENGKRPISAEDLRTWCRVCQVPAERTEELLAERNAVAGMWVSYNRLHRSGLKQAQTAVRPVYERAIMVRSYQTKIVPGLLQTPGTTTAQLDAVRRTLRLTVNDVAEAVAERMERQKVLWSGRCRFLFVIEEAVLRYRTCDAATHAVQLQHLLTVMSLPAVSLGIIPTDAPRLKVWPEESFVMFDDELVAVELVSGVLNITQPREIALYRKSFTVLSGLAVHGDKARALIRSALEALERE